MPTPEDLATSEAAPAAPESSTELMPDEKYAALGSALDRAKGMREGLAEALKHLPTELSSGTDIEYLRELKETGYEISDEEMGAFTAVLAARKQLDSNLDIIYKLMTRTGEDKRTQDAARREKGLGTSTI